jgi:hypothetical protein
MNIATLTELIRAALARRVSEAEILRALNDGYRDIAARAFCIERKFKLPTVAGARAIPFPWGIRINHVETIPAIDTADPPHAYTPGDDEYLWADDEYEPYRGAVETDPEVREGLAGLIRIAPSMCGRVPLDGRGPQYWFSWGLNLCIEPIPAEATWLRLYIARYPQAALEPVANQTPIDLPESFHGCLADFAIYTLAISLRRWNLMATHYNRYIIGIQRRHWGYIHKRPDGEKDRRIPARVVLSA